MGHFPAPEPNCHFYLIAPFKKAGHGPGFDVIIMGINIGAHLDFFDVLCALAFTGGGFLFLLFKPELAVIENFHHGFFRIWSHFDEIKSGFAGSRECFVDGDDAAFFTCFCNEEDLGRDYIIIYSRALWLLRRGGGVGSSSYTKIS